MSVVSEMPQGASCAGGKIEHLVLPVILLIFLRKNYHTSSLHNCRGYVVEITCFVVIFTGENGVGAGNRERSEREAPGLLVRRRQGRAR